MSNKRHITCTFICIVCEYNIFNILPCFVYTCKLICIKINKIHCIVKLFIEEYSVILIKKLALSNIKKKLKIINKALHIIINCADICTLKNLTATAHRKTFGISFVIRLTSDIAHHFKMKGFFVIYVGRKKHSFSVGVNTAYIFSVYSDTDFCGGFKAEPELLTL